MGFCYEILIPPRSTPLFWYMNSTPTHYKNSSRIRSLQLSLTSTIWLISLCGRIFSNQYNIALSPEAWDELEANLHKYPTKGYL